ncbi:MAG: hypothetical protein PGN22_06265 [Agrobacterium cavarae]
MRLVDVVGYLKRAEQISVVIGAGASRSAGIPTAPLLVKQINDEFTHCLVELTDDERKDYGRTMGALAPGDRKSLIQPLLDKSKVNWGHIALACITRKISVKRVLTFNFDLILEKAASLVGMHLPVYDFGVAPTGELSGLAAPAIFHLHGQSYGLRLMNSQEETDAHKEVLRPLLADSLRNHLTVVIGYSGEADAAFKIIEEEYNSHLNLIWLGYEPEPKPHLATLLAKKYAFYVGGCDFDRTMIDIAEMLGCWPPEVIKNPPQHILTELTEVSQYPVEPEIGLDLLTSTRRRLEESAVEWETGKDSEAKAQEALISGTVPDAAGPSEHSTDDERQAIAWGKIRKANDLVKQALMAETYDELLDTLESSVPLFQEAMSFAPDLVQSYQGLAGVLINKARRLEGIARDDALDQAENNLNVALGLEPDNSLSLRMLGHTLDQRSRFAEPDARPILLDKAQLTFEKLLFVDPEGERALEAYATFLAASLKFGDDDIARSATVKEIEDIMAKIRHVTGGKASYNIACILAMLGEKNRALEELERCGKSERLPPMRLIEQDEDLDLIRDEPRFKDLLRRIRK